MATLEATLAARTREAALYERGDGGRVRCHACGHHCPIPDGAAGVCHVRFNRDGRLYAPWGYVAGLQFDPIEKKPFYHAWPGSLACSFGMLGCDLHCAFCQNWISSQALRDPAAGGAPAVASPDGIVEEAVRLGARAVVSTYNEPLITAEWGAAIFQRAKAAGLATGIVSNGYGSAEVVEFLRPWLDLVKIDLKSFDDRTYRRLGGRLDPVLDTIRGFHAASLWIEIVTLIVPGLNDSDDELRRLAGFIASVSPDVPWHVTSFHREYRMLDGRDTTVADLQRAARIGRAAGLRYVYAGNIPGRVGDLEQTRCVRCAGVLVDRVGFRVLANRVGKDGSCPDCGAPVAGRW